jgi:type IV pilus assembly protein PilP
MNVTPNNRMVLIFLVAIFLLFSCDQSKPYSDLQSFIDKLQHMEVKHDDAELVKKKNEPEPVSVKYESGARRSPFEMMDVAPTKNIVSLNPLQAYPLDMLRFVGTVSQKGTNIAFVSAPDNKLYQLKVGDIIGDRNSQIVAIESDRISLIEQYTENGNATMKRVVTLQLKEAN